MSFFIPSAMAAPAQAPGEPNPLITLVMFGGLFLFMYLMIIRPQRKRQKEHRSLVANLAKGDENIRYRLRHPSLHIHQTQRRRNLW